MIKRKPLLTSRFYEALALAFDLHGQDFRKSSQVPVMAHLLSVCSFALYDGGDEDDAIAALLHDALEDKPEKITCEELGNRFGNNVKKIIKASIDVPLDYRGGPKEDWLVRKERYLKHARHAEPRLLRVTVADKVDNIRSMLADHASVGNKFWERFNAPQEKQIWYFTEAIKAYQEAGFKGLLLEELCQLVEKLRQIPPGQ